VRQVRRGRPVYKGRLAYLERKDPQVRSAHKARLAPQGHKDRRDR